MVVVASSLASAVAPGIQTAAGANFTAGQAADLLLGATSFTSMAYGDGTAMLRGMYYPNGVAVDAGGSVYVADTNNYRVTRWSAPATNGENFTNVLMKVATANPSMKQAWYSTLLEGTNDTQGIAVSGDAATTSLAIADRSHNRIVLSKGETTTDTETSSLGTSRVVLGQPNFSSNGTGYANTQLQGPADAWTDGTKIAVADSDNHRVLLFNSWPAANGAAAGIVLGQSGYGALDHCPNKASTAGVCDSYTSGTAAAAVGRDTMRRPKGVYFDGSWLYVADTSNERILVWTSWPTVDNQLPDYVIGQADFTSTGSTCSATGLNYPIGVAATGTGAGHRLAIVAAGQHRVVILDAFPTAPSNGKAFNSVVGQSNFINCADNRGGSAPGTGTAAANSLRDPNDATYDAGGQLWIADTGNHRVVRHPTPGTFSSADLVLGHAGAGAMTASHPNDDTSGNTFFRTGSTGVPGGRVALSNSGLLVKTDPNDQSMRIWNTAPTSTNQAFDVRWGQDVRTDSGFNSANGTRSATTTYNPAAPWTDGTRLLLADASNNRVLVWTSMPATDTTPADYVLGQASMTTGATGSSLAQLNYPNGVTSDGTDIYVADANNHRILVYRNFWATPANGKSANVQLGTGSSGVSATQLNLPYAVDISQNKLVAADWGNHRIVVWNGASGLTTGAAIDAVVGQASATVRATGTITQAVTQVSAAGGAVFWSQQSSARVLDPLPSSGFVPTGGQILGTGSSSVPTATSTQYVQGIAARSGTVWADDDGHARNLRWTDAIAPTLTVAPTATVLCDGTVTITWTTSESTTTELYSDTVTRATYPAYAQSSVDPLFTGLTHSVALNYATPGTRYARVRGVDWAGLSVVSSEISFTVPANCPAPTTMLADDLNAQSGTGRANPSATNTPPIQSSSFHTSWQNVAGVTMDRYESQTWTTPPEQAGGMWHFDGSLAGDTNATYSGAGSWTGGATYGAGKFGSNSMTSAADRYVTIPHNAAISKANDFSVDLWFRTSSIALSNYPILIMKSGDGCGTGSHCNYSLEFDRVPNNICAVVTRSSDNNEMQACTSAAGLVNNQWHHAAMTITATNQMSLFVDGVLASGPTALGASADTNTGDLTVGADSGNFEKLAADIDELRFTPKALSAADILGYYRTQRPHLQLLHGSGVGGGTGVAIGADCATATRCADQAYDTPGTTTADILKPGARYWTRARLHTKVNDYWSSWSTPDWLETNSLTTLSISVGAALDFGTPTSGQDSFRSSTIDVATNDPSGYKLSAHDASNTVGMVGTPSGTIPDARDPLLAPAAWAANAPLGIGVTVRSAPVSRLAQWGATGPFPENDTTNNLYAGLGTADTLLHQRNTYGTGTDSIVLTTRLDAPLATLAGSYTTTIQLTAVANP